MDIFYYFPISGPFFVAFVLAVMIYGAMRLFRTIREIREEREIVRQGKMAAASRKLEKQLEMQDPWYPKHDEWMDWGDVSDLARIAKTDPILAIQTKLELWIAYQEDRVVPPLPDLTPVLRHSGIKDMKYGVRRIPDVVLLPHDAQIVPLPTVAPEKGVQKESRTSIEILESLRRKWALMDSRPPVVKKLEDVNTVLDGTGRVIFDSREKIKGRPDVMDDFEGVY